mgnify:CR=1 FL=1
MKPTKPLSLTIDPRIFIIALLIVIIAMVAIWKPWESTKTERSITINGSGSVEAVPDEFIFSPYFDRKGTDTKKLKTELDDFGTKLLDEVKKLGVKKDDITLNSSGYDTPNYGKTEIAPTPPDGQPTPNTEQVVSLSVTIKATDTAIAQKVQDYLATTDAKGMLTSQPDFSKGKRDNLEGQARDKAIKDARTKAESSAKNLNVTVGKVVSVKEGNSQSPVYPLYGGVTMEDSTARSGLPVTPGKNTVTSTVEVVFEIR